MARDEQDTKLLPNRAFAAKLGVTPRTLYTWEKTGVLAPALRIKGRIYRRADDLPRFDGSSDRRGGA